MSQSPQHHPAADRRPGGRPVPGRSAGRTRRERPAVLRRRHRHLRSRQRRRRRPGTAAVPQGLPALPGPQRAGHGPHGHRLREDEEPARRAGLQLLDRSRRDEHDHRCRHRHREPAARAVPAQRHLRQPTDRTGAPAAGVELLLGLLGQRRVQGGLQVLGPDQPARPAAHRPPGGDAHPDQPGRHRRRHARPPAGRAGRSLGLPDRAVPGTHLVRAAGPSRPRRAAPRRPADRRRQTSGDHRRRRRHLLRRHRRAGRPSPPRPASRSG